MQIAILADPHHHDIHGRYGDPEPRAGALRTLADTVASTRVFNESYPALRAALDAIAARGIRLVVIPGDLTDDGQAATVTATLALLETYERRHGLRFFMTPGNHDLYAHYGRHQSKTFLEPGGGHTLFTSDPGARDAGAGRVVVTDAMYCDGYRDGLAPLARFGFFRQPADIHWETPFGADDDLAARTYEITSEDGAITRRLIDASYLVEPVPGLWLLSIDANVFVPRNGETDPRPERSYHDSTDAGWTALIAHKRFLLDWITGVTGRAGAAGKRLLVFSHYPLVDPLNGTLDDEMALFGRTSLAIRTPVPEAAEAAIAAGLKVHFSGHLHINATGIARSHEGTLVNVAVPAPVAFPPAFKLVSFAGGHMRVETVPLNDVPGFDSAFDAYREELALTGTDYGDLLEAGGHAEFLSRHLEQMVRYRFLPREWPADLAGIVPGMTLGDLAGLAAEPAPLDAASLQDWLGARAPRPRAGWRALPFLALVVDWYRLCRGRHLALDFIAEERLEAYRRLIAAFAAGAWPSDSIQARLAIFLAMLGRYMDDAPSVDFTIDLATGEIAPIYRGRTDLRQTGST